MRSRAICFLLLTVAIPRTGLPALRAGAAKVDVTPPAAELPKTYDGILDHLYSRAIVLDTGNARAALITVDAGAIPNAVWKAVCERVEKDLGIPARKYL
jgi:neutral ceramidase